MSVKISTGPMLLEALMDLGRLKAALLVDDRGYIIDKRGEADAIGDEPGAEGPRENVYMVEAGEEILLVVFDDKLNFERVKSDVDGTLAQFDMAPPTA